MTPSGKTDRAWIITIAIAMFASLSLAASLTSDGFLEADGCTHYLYSRFAFEQPHFLVNIWGRPFCTAFYAVPALLGGRFGVRCASLVLAIAISLITYLIAKRQGFRHPELALIFTLAQPLVFLHSIAELTELPFAFLLSLAFLAFQSRRWFYMAVVAAILPLARPEGFGFLILAAIALMGRDRWWWIFVLPIGLIAWSYAGWTEYGSPAYPWYLWLIRNWPYAEKSAYAPGSILHYVNLLPAIVSPLVFPAVVLGAWQALISRRDWLIAAIPLGIFVGHSFLYATGRMASSGEIRYLLIVAPFWALLAARGWDWFFAWRGWAGEARYALLAAVLPVFINLGYQILPLVFTDDWLRARLAVQWWEDSGLAGGYPRVQSSHPGIYYFMGICQTDPDHAAEWKDEFISTPGNGVVLVWDWIYGTHNADRSRVIQPEQILQAGWIPLAVPAVEDGWRDRQSTWQIFLSPRDINGRTTQPAVPGRR